MSVSTTPCRVTPPLGARAQHMTASTIPRLSVWPCGSTLGTQGGSDIHLRERESFVRNFTRGTDTSSHLPARASSVRRPISNNTPIAAIKKAITASRSLPSSQAFLCVCVCARARKRERERERARERGEERERERDRRRCLKSRDATC